MSVLVPSTPGSHSGEGALAHVVGSGGRVSVSVAGSASAHAAPKHPLQLQRKVAPAPRAPTYRLVVHRAHFTSLRRLDSREGRCGFAEALRTQNELHKPCQEARPPQMFLVSRRDAPDPISIPGMNTMNTSLQFHLLTTSHVFKKKFPGLSTVEKYTYTLWIILFVEHSNTAGR